MPLERRKKAVGRAHSAPGAVQLHRHALRRTLPAGNFVMSPASIATTLARIGRRHAMAAVASSEGLCHSNRSHPAPIPVGSWAMKLPLWALFVVGCGAASPPPAAVSSGTSTAAPTRPNDGLTKLSSEQLTRKLLQITGAEALGNQVADGMLESFRTMPNLPPGFLERFKQNLQPQAVTELIVPIYIKHLDREALIEAIRFYGSAPGQRIVKTLPVVMAESMEVGRAWGAELARKTLQDLASGAP